MPHFPNIYIIVAAHESNRAIGCNGSIPWKCPEDMEHYVKTTKGSGKASIMGRKTRESLPNGGVLRDRLNITISSTLPGAFRSLEDALHFLSYNPDIKEIFIIGGENLYKEALAMHQCTRIYITRVRHQIDELLKCDAFMPEFETSGMFVKDSEIKFKHCNCSSEVWVRPHEEYQYLKLVKDILENGEERGDRTGVGTKSIFSPQTVFKFDLSKGLPVLTTKKVFTKGIIEELLWFIKGQTDSKILEAKGVNIWKGNTSREFLDGKAEAAKKKGNLELEQYWRDLKEGDCGPVYGFSWRHFGAEYQGSAHDYTGQGVDQLAWVIEQLKTNPKSRQIMMSAFNPATVDQCVLPACHPLCQFSVSNDGRLSCAMYQRSADFGLGVPYNSASYGLLTCMLAHVVSLKPGFFIHHFGDAHAYKNHIEQLQEQITRTPFPFPTLWLNPEVKNIDDFTFQDIKIQNYQSHPAIQMQMAV